MNAVTLLLDEIAAKIGDGGGAAHSGLGEAADRLRRFAEARTLSPRAFPPAMPGQAMLHELGRHPACGIALYLVSDAPSIRSPPHDHETWAIVLGLDGIERNTIYRVIDPWARTVEPVSTVTLKAGESVVLLPDAIHATEALGPRSTYHLHLYGRPLDSLPPFAMRTYRAV